jgi:ABC-type Zn uptake system ZnuABC Zn-binding protein ZnuA
MRRRIVVVAAVSVVVLLLALLAVPLAARYRGQTTAGAGPRVVASTTVFVDLVRQVGGDRLASVDSIVPAGTEVEDYDPTPENLRTLSRANLLVMNGLALDSWIPELVGAARPGISTLVLSDGLPALDEDNPHLWLDVQYTRVYVERIRDALRSADPDGGEQYAANAAAYLSQLDALDAWIVEQVTQLPPERRKLVTFHDAFPYFAARYGFAVIGVITPSPGHEPSAGELATLVREVRAAQVPAVFGEAASSPRLIETLAAEAGVADVVSDLYTDSLGEAPVDSYVGMMRFNVERIVQALM